MADLQISRRRWARLVPPIEPAAGGRPWIVDQTNRRVLDKAGKAAASKPPVDAQGRRIQEPDS